jgi:hypothetical protein
MTIYGPPPPVAFAVGLGMRVFLLSRTFCFRSRAPSRSVVRAKIEDL